MSELGFVIIGRNEGPRLERCFRSVLSVTNRVVYADSASTDESVATAERLGVAVVSLPQDGRLTAARGRNAGYRKLRELFPDCTLVQFLDGDCVLQPQWIGEATAFLSAHPDVAVVCGRRFEARPRDSVFNALCDLEWNTPVGEATECGGDALVRCSAFDQVGGYRDELQAGEEPEMTARMRAKGWRVWRIDAPMTEHDANIHKLRQWWRRTQRGGFGYAQVWTATKGLPQRLYAKSLRSAIAWALLFPLAVGVLALVARNALALLLIPALYAIQIVRIALRGSGELRWTRASLVMLAKVPEALGALRFATSRGRRLAPEYKTK